MGEYAKNFIAAVGGKLFLLPSALGGCITVYNFIAQQLEWPHMSWWVVLPLALTIVGVWALVGLLFHVVKLQRRLTPQLTINFEPAAPWVRPVWGNVPYLREVETGGSPSTQLVPGTKKAKCIFVRFEVNAETVAAVRNCTAMITNVEYRAGTRWKQTVFGESLNLRWTRTQSHEAIEVRRGARLFVDLFSADEIHNEIFVKWELRLNANESIFAKHGLYRLTVIVSSDDGPPTTAQFIVDWRGEWDSLSIGMGGGKRKKSNGTRRIIRVRRSPQAGLVGPVCQVKPNQFTINHPEH